MGMRLALIRGIPLRVIYNEFTNKELTELYIFDSIERKADIKLQAQLQGASIK